MVNTNEQITITGLSKSYGKKTALSDINLSIDKGMYGLLGRNGAGKTTLMKIIATLLNINEGSINVCGIPINKEREIRRIIGYLPQEFSMYPNMKVTEALDYLAVLSEVNYNVRKTRAVELIDMVNLNEHKNKRIKSLSGGMKRRLGIAQALINDPKVLIVDEPTAGLDPEERIRFRNLLSKVAEDRIVILSTHIVGDIEATCENIGILNEGKLLFNGAITDLLHKAEGSVYEIAVPRDEVDIYRKNYMITSIRHKNDTTNLRIISDVQLKNAEAVEPNIEDAYMLYLHREGVENDVIL